MIFIRDLDSLITDKEQLAKRFDYFREFRTVVDNKAVYMLNIWKIEDLILCDLDAFMNHYTCTCSFDLDLLIVENPKEFLKKLHSKYHEVDNAEIFGRIKHELLLENSKFYSQFIRKFEKFLAN